MTDTTIETGRVLTARSVSKSYGPVRALIDADIVVRPGRVHAVVGENGAGKSTLAKVVAGIESPDAAQMRLGDVPYAPRDRAHARALGVNMVPQQLSLVGELSLVENLLLVGAGRIARRGRARQLLRETLRRADVDVDLDAPTARLSQAQRQLGEIVVALAEGAQVLILDEPTASLGPIETGGLFRHLRALCAQGTAIVLITHRLDEVREVADEVTVLSHGRVVHHGPATGLAPAEIARLMVGELPEPAPRRARTAGAEVLSVRGVHARSDADGDLRDVSLTLRAGEIVGLAGVSGSGQNLLLDVLAGLVAPTTGVVEQDGTALTAAGALRAGIAWIPEERADALVPAMAAGETLDLYRAAAGAPSGDAPRDASRSARRQRHTAVLQDFDVRPPRPQLAASGFSGGNQQKLLIARELGPAGAGRGHPRVVLAYGPTQGLDLRAAQAVRERLVAAAEAGAAVLVASHDLEELLQISDRVLVMFGGRLVADLPASHATTENLGRAMAGLAEDQ